MEINIAKIQKFIDDPKTNGIFVTGTRSQLLKLDSFLVKELDNLSSHKQNEHDCIFVYTNKQRENSMGAHRYKNAYETYAADKQYTFVDFIDLCGDIIDIQSIEKDFDKLEKTLS